MGRQMVGLRKGAPPAAPEAPADDSSNVVECPNCKCQFDPVTKEIVNAPDSGENEGVDVLGNELPAPLNPAAAARGETAVADLLKGMR